MKWPDPSVFGNAAQWVSAGAGLATLLVAIYGVSAVAPYFQNRLLSEQKAELELAVREKQQTLKRLEFNGACASASNEVLRWLYSRVGIDGYDSVQKQTELVAPLANYSAIFARLEQTESFKKLPLIEQERIKDAWRSDVRERHSATAPIAAERADVAVAWYLLNARTISQQLELACLMARQD